MKSEYSVLRSESSFEILRVKDLCHSYPTHTHTRVCMGRIDSGCKILNINDKCFSLKKGDCFFIPAKIPHSCMDGKSEEKTGYTIFCAERIDLLFKLIKMFDVQFFEYLQKINPEHLFSQFCYYQSNADGKEDALFKKIINFIDNNYEDQLTVNNLARQFCISSFHLLHRFKKSAGLSLHQYILQARLKKFKENADLERSMTDQALSCGFYDQSHLNKLFKRHTGISPLKYVKSLRTM